MKALIYIAVVILLQPLAHAQWNMNPNVNTQVAAHNSKFNYIGGYSLQSDPFPRLSTGQFLVHWSVENSTGTSIATSVFAQLLNPDGRKAWGGWGIMLVDSLFSQAKHSYDVLASADDRMYVFFHRNSYKSDTNRRYNQLNVQRFDRLGQARWPNGGKLIGTGVYSYSSASNQRYRPISAQIDGNAFVTIFQEYAYLGGNHQYRFRMQRIDSTGAAYLGPEGAAITPWSRMGESAVNADGLFADQSGGLFFFYTAFENFRSHIFMQHLDSNGVTRWPGNGILVNEGSYSTAFPRITPEAGGFFNIVTYHTISGASNSPSEHYAQTVDTAGNVYWRTGGVKVFERDTSATNTLLHGLSFPASIVSDGGGGMIVIANPADTIIGSTTYRCLRAQRIDRHGISTWGRNGVVLQPWYDSTYIHSYRLVTDGQGGAILVYDILPAGWDNNRGWNIRGQRIDSTGRKLWGEAGIPISTADSNQQRPILIADGQGGAVVVWMDWRNITYPSSYTGYKRSEIYATRIGPNGNAYPVELSTFTARLDAEVVRLDWRTESEANNAGFEIERAIPPPSPVKGAYEAANWQRIGYVPGNGSTNVSQSYMYHDALTPELLGQSELLYRLRQIDYDGTHVYSHVARVLVNPPTAVSLEAVYPNPAHGSALLRFALPSEQRVRLALYDVLGREVLLVHEGSLPTGVHEYEAHLDQLPAGLYHVLLTTPLGRQARRMVVVR